LLICRNGARKENRLGTIAGKKTPPTSGERNEITLRGLRERAEVKICIAKGPASEEKEKEGNVLTSIRKEKLSSPRSCEWSYRPLLLRTGGGREKGKGKDFFVSLARKERG